MQLHDLELREGLFESLCFCLKRHRDFAAVAQTVTERTNVTQNALGHKERIVPLGNERQTICRVYRSQRDMALMAALCSFIVISPPFEHQE